MQSVKVVTAVCALIGALAGCSVIPQDSGPRDRSLRPVPATQSVSHMKCEQTEQEGCFEIDILNVRWDHKFPFVKEVDASIASKADRSKLGKELYEAYKAKRVQASVPRTFTIFMWQVNDVPTSHLMAYQLDGKVLTKVSVVEGTGGLRPPNFDAPFADIGKPNKIFQVKTDGKSPIGAALQFPWSMVTSKTYILVCSEDRLTVYPNRVTAEEGLWLTPKALNDARDKGFEYMLLPFISKDAPPQQPSIKKPVVKKPPVKKAEGEEQLALASTE